MNLEHIPAQVNSVHGQLCMCGILRNQAEHLLGVVELIQTPMPITCKTQHCD